jgi:hypothetical protein
MQQILQAPVTKTAAFDGPALNLSNVDANDSTVIRLHVTKLTPTSAALLQLQHCPDTTAQTPVWTPAAAWQIQGQVTELRANTIHSRDLPLTARTIFRQEHGAIRISLAAIVQDAQTPAPSVTYAAWLETEPCD